jgi:hypothetical protein
MNKDKDESSFIPKLLTKTGRASAGVFLSAVGVVMIFSLVFVAGGVEWGRNVGLVAGTLVTFVIIGIALYLQHSTPASPNMIASQVARKLGKKFHKERADREKAATLLNAAKILAEEEMKQLESEMRRWQAVVVRRISFREMSFWGKIGGVFMMVLGSFFLVLGTSDLLGFGSELQLPNAAGEVVTFPHWQTGLVTIVLGLVSLSFSRVFLGVKVTDRWEEGLRKLKEDLDIK